MKYTKLCLSPSLGSPVMYSPSVRSSGNAQLYKNGRTVAQKTRPQGCQEVLSSSLEIVSQIGPTRCFPFPLLGVDAC